MGRKYKPNGRNRSPELVFCAFLRDVISISYSLSDTFLLELRHTFKETVSLLVLFFPRKIQRIHPFTVTHSATICARGPGSSVGIATDYGLDGPGSSPGGGTRFSARPYRPWGPPSLLYDGYPVFPAGVKCGRGVLLTTHPLLVRWSWKSRVIPLPTLWATPGL